VIITKGANLWAKELAVSPSMNVTLVLSLKLIATIMKVAKMLMESETQTLKLLSVHLTANGISSVDSVGANRVCTFLNTDMNRLNAKRYVWRLSIVTTTPDVRAHGANTFTTNIQTFNLANHSVLLDMIAYFQINASPLGTTHQDMLLAKKCTHKEFV
jgi:hypothetical protein